ncbi:MAG: hypothetical protein LUQ25_06100 [Methanoregulaceae archaeon]|nr:hypothetical protein [Methanoregulaceae archaeon]
MAAGSRSIKAWIFPFIILLLLFLATAGTVSAHAPLSAGSNEDLGNATLIDDPEKSFVIYTELREGNEAQYYRFPMRKGQILSGSLGVPGPEAMIPDIVVIGPGIEPAGTVPPFIRIPAGSGARLVPGTRPGKPVYEPFSPQPIYNAADFNIPIASEGTYYIAVYGTSGGKYYLAPGFLEQFTVAEQLLIPWSVVGIHLWQGQSLQEIFAPLIVVLIAGFLCVFLRRKKQGARTASLHLLVLLSGLLYIGGAAMTAYQVYRTILVTGYSSGVLITLILIALPVVLGIAALMAGTRYPGADFPLKTGIAMILIGVLGLLVWAGLILGPVIALASGVFIIVRGIRKP